MSSDDMKFNKTKHKNCKKHWYYKWAATNFFQLHENLVIFGMKMNHECESMHNSTEFRKIVS